MKTIDSRFGEIAYDPQQVLTFPQGLIGFEELREFVVMPNSKEGPLFWIQSVEDAQVALVLTDPTNFFLDYKVVPEAHERAILGIEADEPCFNLVVVTVHPDRRITLNLAAPILFAARTNRALQVILENSGYSIQTPLPVVQPATPPQQAASASA
ncbi:flagellar assembly protein FliW [Desulfuromonas thiophila]|uniref:Flagellar assembly factor FliW n=1 Tax=Desulfuromonas thiophila TaxID=57664 RepID=A0A1G7BHK6_9BACT|nr:flagellar assembly protein FliW [Desulfuromonas thiophila]SDE26462.1 flagellar assembly factor FliW [Desulfuromonas thiophila]